MNLFGATKAKSSFVKLDLLGTDSQYPQGGQQGRSRDSMKADVLQQSHVDVSTGHKYLHTGDQTPRVSSCRKFLAVVLTILAVTGERVVNSYHLRRSRCHVFCYWLQSCVAVVFFTAFICKRRNFPSGGLRQVVKTTDPINIMF